MTRWIPGLAGIAVLAWLPGSLHDVDTPSTPRPSESEFPTAIRPGMRADGPLAVAELRWCMREEVRLETIHPRLATRRAAARYNQLAADYNVRCSGRKSGKQERDEAITDIAGARQSIVTAALEEIGELNNEGPLTPRRAQQLLSMLAYDPGGIDGVYGPQTRAAVEAFQREEGILVDGLLSQDLLDRMLVTLTRNHTGWSERVAVAVYVTEANSRRPISGAEIAISSDRGLQKTGTTNEHGRVRFVGVPIGNLEIRVQRDGGGATFQAAITEDPRQEVWIVVP